MKSEERAFYIRVVIAIVNGASRYPLRVLGGAALLFAFLAFEARGLEVRSDLTELLPKDSPRYRAFEHQLGRAGGGSTLIVIMESPDRAANEQFANDLAARVRELATREPELVAYVESGTSDVRAFYEKSKWLYADLDDLERIDSDLDHQIALKSGMVEDLEGPSPTTTTATTATTTATDEPPKSALGLGDALKKWDDHIASLDTFPTGYFESPDGHLVGIRIAANASLGGSAGDRIVADVEALVADVRLLHPNAINVGLTGDIASAAGEKKALVSQALGATVIAIAIILLAIVIYFRSAWSLLVIGAPVALGVVAAYAFARLAFGYVNTAGAFLGAIIVGNGINYPIVLLARYREFRSRGMGPNEARREAVVNALRAELLGACVAAIAYGSLVVTHFRGFRQFGAIGFVGMLLIWASIVPLVPAIIVVEERIEAFVEPRWPRLSSLLAWRIETPNPNRPKALSIIARVTTAKTPRKIILFATVFFTLVMATRIPRWIVDPWEYDFGKLGSRSSDISGAGEWSDKANVVFGGKMNIAGALMIADSAAQVPLLKAQILANDAKDPKGTMIAEVTTVDDVLPGSQRQQKAKLDVLDRIRERLTPRVLADLTDDEQKTASRARPPDDLRVLGITDLPALLRRRFTERNGTVGTVFYVKPKNEIVFADAHNHLRLSATTDNVQLPDGTIVMTASRSTIFAEMLDSLRRDGPLVSAVSFGAVIVVVFLLSRDRRRVALPVIVALVIGVTWLLGAAALMNVRLNYVNFIALPITFGIGCEYPFNIADRTRLLGGDPSAAIERSGGAVLLCSFTTIVGYGSMLLSDFQALESFGKLAVMGEMACAFAAIFFLPTIILRRPARSR